ncbi:hypothetical protein PSTG_10797 [Puccinia striiformis f. sp. tritici PST-78]|uniref:Histidine-specific methyltransferase SAM-dependent domain-containing protein n=1 Tax=Puccinia striiformis f. sp. tritici PST-78 TaxID=1165861 RepID=A0A0L0V9B2_9BASI|nr:hypothetical protein PSTG_10797 [Puccinia striiformis f. sp. tritici PST-78]
MSGQAEDNQSYPLREANDPKDGVQIPHIIDLRACDPSDSSGSTELSLRQEITQGLLRKTVLVPGPSPADRSFAYSKVIPTVALYDNFGLQLYDEITAVEDYYPFKTELAILRAKSHEIACRLGGISTASTSNLHDSSSKFADEGGNTSQARSNSASSLIQPGVTVPQDSTSPPVQATGGSLTIIELGAGSLKKTSHLLGNVAGLLQTREGDRTEQRFSQAEYYALDLELEQLRSTLSAIQLQTESGVGPGVGRQVQGYGICGTYNQGLDWIYKWLMKTSEAKSIAIEKAGSRKAILWLGSSIGNFSPAQAVKFLRDELGRALDNNTRVLIGIDNCQIPEKVQLAYDDRQGVTQKFILNAIRVVARQLGLCEDVLNPEQFDYVSRYNVGMSRNEAYLRAKHDMRFEIPIVAGVDTGVQDTLVRIKAGELLMIERSYKFSPDDVYRLFDQAGLRVIQKWNDSPDPVAPTHTLYLVERAPFHFVRSVPWPSVVDEPLSSAELPAIHKEETSNWELLLQVWDTMSKLSLPVRISGIHQLSSTNKKFASQKEKTSTRSKPLKMQSNSKNSGGLPSISDWTSLWKAWDTVTVEMIPRDKLHLKPIDLRHACLFYLGHIPVFADIHLSRYFNVPTTEPQWFAQIFERGIDPNLDDPSRCNDHSPFPKQENEWPSIEEVFQFRDKFRTRLTETYAGLGKQSGSKILLTRKLGRVLSMIYEHEAMHLETLLYMLQQTDFVNQPSEFTPPDWHSLAQEWNSTAEAQSEEFELIEYKTSQMITVGHDDLEADDSSSPFSEAHEYGWDNESPSRKVEVKPFKLEPATINNQEYLDFAIEGLPEAEPVPHHLIPESWVYLFNLSDPKLKKHQVQVKTIYGRIDFRFAKHWPVQASGRQFELFAQWKGGRLPTADELRVYLSDNPISQSAQNPIGFLNWHPLPPRRPRKGVDGRWRGGWSGGVWEWTSTKFESHPNFKSSDLYPGYSKDFFDGEHNILLGGSWATIPRIAHRPSFVNWYQFKYPYVFAGGRVAYDY